MAEVGCPELGYTDMHEFGFCCHAHRAEGHTQLTFHLCRAVSADPGCVQGLKRMAVCDVFVCVRARPFIDPAGKNSLNQAIFNSRHSLLLGGPENRNPSLKALFL